MEYITIRATNLTNADGNDMGKVYQNVTYTINSIVDKNIKGINRRMVSANRYIPISDIEPIAVNPPSEPLEKQRMFIQTFNGIEYVTTETWERIA